MDTKSLYLALSEETLEDIILPEKRNEWEAIRSRDCTDSFTANATSNFFPRTYCSAHKKHNKREPGLFKEEFRCSEMLCLCSKSIVATIERVTSTISVARDSIKELWKTGDGLSESVRRGSQSYFNQQRISNNETYRRNLRTDKKVIVLFLPKLSCTRRWNTY